ncbi:PREDICTED: zinc finger and BTB domain-containing protein 14 isoform X3 [Nicrophorus vespilloides]|uniref:Zinc finger and BTB domain-containing protein 14 isoform X3 n=1 Tax=Nicrophorus vespilloides TaxID=110193 RepID=A0ABM1MB44_NICVS|nr:PREDICTED: zinc finger and BTB domain-containing protein 14 isoform X3 [Nicrophorus vespilloides]
MESSGDEQQFCLRWNNFQANITSQFETLRDDEDFTDVTIACEGQRLQAHKVVLSACSPYFKELFKNNPCSHPIIFMRDVEAKHVVALMEFMYAGEVNVAQAHLSAFLKTAESLKIRGLTDTTPIKEDQLYMKSNLEKSIQGNSTVTSSQDLLAGSSTPPPAAKRQGNPEAESNESDLLKLKELNDAIIANPFENLDICGPKVELPDYLSDEDKEDARNYYLSSINNLTGGMEIIPQNSSKESSTESLLGADSRKLHSLEPRPCEECGRTYSNLSNLRQHMKLIHYPTFVSCPICAKSFKTDLYLRRHMGTAHEIINCKKLETEHTTIKTAYRMDKPSSRIANRMNRPRKNVVY